MDNNEKQDNVSSNQEDATQKRRGRPRKESETVNDKIGVKAKPEAAPKKTRTPKAETSSKKTVTKKTVAKNNNDSDQDTSLNLVDFVKAVVDETKEDNSSAKPHRPREDNSHYNRSKFRQRSPVVEQEEASTSTERKDDIDNNSSNSQNEESNNSEYSQQRGNDNRNYRNGRFQERRDWRNRNNNQNRQDFQRDEVVVNHDIRDLQAMEMPELVAMAQDLEIENTSALCKNEIIYNILKKNTEDNGLLYGGGVIEVLPDGYGFLRQVDHNYKPSVNDVYISASQVKRFSLATGDTVLGQVRSPRGSEKFFVMLKVESINGYHPSEKNNIVRFDNLIPEFPRTRLHMECGKKELSMRAMDLITPVGRGQRGLIVAAPRTGKTVMLTKIANSIVANNDDVELIILLIDERPEEVTDMRRCVPSAEVISSTFDEHPERHLQVAEMVMNKAKRLVEYKKHVVILLDSITRLARAYNMAMPNSGRILSGGLDVNALHVPKRFFGAARNIDGGGSLTILATALVETGSKMDDVIFEEFKGTGNMELNLDRSISDRRIYPAINIEKSGTRREDLLVNDDELARMWALRRAFHTTPPAEAMEMLLKKLKMTDTNIQVLLSLPLDKIENMR